MGALGKETVESGAWRMSHTVADRNKCKEDSRQKYNRSKAPHSLREQVPGTVC